ncbi:hypothetical protein B0H17DRAFT_1145342 [Mycena rosella]|uniref:Uncharacterized protein n=1 Tax=Mycena rosella TaxID=1033263 RepID=A0AAD7CTU9_MYCRO|nr:hypothetical protein B0H17DRAFT_1145342 [Mycena rosella]
MCMSRRPSFMLPPELVELIIYHAWGYLSTSSHRHAYSMAQWMLVSHDWLQIVISVVFRDLWITSYAHIGYITHICRSNNPSFICELAGITDVPQHLAQTCRSLTISVYHSFEGEYASQCTELVEYATTDSHRDELLPGVARYRSQRHAMKSIATVIWDFTTHITALHFVLVDCTATYGGWNTLARIQYHVGMNEHYPLSLIALHVTVAYTSPPPALLLDAPRGTFFPPPSRWDLPWHCRFDGGRERGFCRVFDDGVSAARTGRVDSGVPCGGLTSDCARGRQGLARLRAPPAYRSVGPDWQRYDADSRGLAGADVLWPVREEAFYPTSKAAQSGSSRPDEEKLHLAPFEARLQATQVMSAWPRISFILPHFTTIRHDDPYSSFIQVLAIHILIY